MTFFGRSRLVAGIVLFGTGVVAGLCAARVEDGHRWPAAPARAEPPTPVSVELTRAGPDGSGATVKNVALGAAMQTEHPERANAPLSTREIAHRALEWTVFLRGGSVYGAGVVLDSEGHVLTCDHVIDGLTHVDAYFDGDPTPIPVAVVARAHDVDLALLKLGKARDLPDIPAVGSVARVAVGDEVFALGAPRKMTFSMSHGIVSYVGRSFDGTFYVQTDLAANDGSSGGPLLDDRGQLIGVSSFILRGSQGLAFAVPIDYAYRRFSRELGARPDAARFERWLASRKSEPDTHEGG